MSSKKNIRKAFLSRQNTVICLDNSQFNEDKLWNTDEAFLCCSSCLQSRNIFIFFQKDLGTYSLRFRYVVSIFHLTFKMFFKFFSLKFLCLVLVRFYSNFTALTPQVTKTVKCTLESFENAMRRSLNPYLRLL